MAKWKQSTIRRRAEQKRRMEEYRKEWADAIARLDALLCRTPQDLYSDERDYEIIGGGEK